MAFEGLADNINCAIHKIDSDTDMKSVDSWMRG